MISSSSFKVSKGSAYRMELTSEEMFLHYLDLILMALDLFRSLMKLMQLFNENWIRQCNWIRLCNSWRASKTIPLPQGECHLCRLVRNKLPLLEMEDDIWSSSMPPKACAPWFKARQNLRPICEKQKRKRKSKLIIPAKAIWVFHLSNKSCLKVLSKCPTSWLHKCEVQTHLLWSLNQKEVGKSFVV